MSCQGFTTPCLSLKLLQDLGNCICVSIDFALETGIVVEKRSNRNSESGHTFYCISSILCFKICIFKFFYIAISQLLYITLTKLMEVVATEAVKWYAAGFTQKLVFTKLGIHLVRKLWPLAKDFLKSCPGNISLQHSLDVSCI